MKYQVALIRSTGTRIFERDTLEQAQMTVDVLNELHDRPGYLQESETCFVIDCTQSTPGVSNRVEHPEDLAKYRDMNRENFYRGDF